MANELTLIPEQAAAGYIMGKIYMEKQDTKNAAAFFNKSKFLAMQVHDSSMIASCNVELSNLEINAGKQKEMEKQLFSSLQTSVEKGDRYTEINSYRFLSDFYSSHKQFDKALAYNEKFHALQDSTKNNELELQLKKLEQDYNLEKKRKGNCIAEKNQQLRVIELQKEKTTKVAAFIFAALLLVIGLLVINRFRVIQKAKRLVEIEKLRNDIARDLHERYRVRFVKHQHQQ